MRGAPSPAQPKIWPAWVYEWGSTPAERAEQYPCDRLLPSAPVVVFRARDAAAPPTVLYRWLCQLRAAPYSYDWIDNLGRRSPRELTAGLDRLAAGQPINGIFRVVEFEPGVSITMATGSGRLGMSACTYTVRPRGAQGSRLVVKMALAPPPGSLRAALLALLFPPGDLVMMARQLRNLAQLAQASAQRARTRP